MLRPIIKDVLSVQELSICIRQLLTDAFPFVAVCGEISNLKQSNGVTFFTLKDLYSQISVTFFKTEAAKFCFQEGKTVIIEGRLEVYVKSGRYQVVGRSVRAVGEGYWQQRLEALKKKLAAEGLFESSRKKPVPAIPKHIGLITSRDGAAIQDFISILKRKGWKGRITLFASLVQGERAALDLVRALHRAESVNSIDLIVIIRGGGSLEDLACFNEETFVRAVANCPKPTLSGVGHEIDTTLCDFAADVRVETPTAAAEKVAYVYNQCLQKFQSATQGLKNKIQFRCQWARQQFLFTYRRLLQCNPRIKLNQFQITLQVLQKNLHNALKNTSQKYQHTLLLWENRLKNVPMRSQFSNFQQKVQALYQSLQSYCKQPVKTFRKTLDFLSHRLHHTRLESYLERGLLIPLNTQQQPQSYAQLPIDQPLFVRHKSGIYQFLGEKK